MGEDLCGFLLVKYYALVEFKCSDIAVGFKNLVIE